MVISLNYYHFYNTHFLFNNKIKDIVDKIFETEIIKILSDEQHNEFVDKINMLVECFEILESDIKNSFDTPVITSERIINFKDAVYKHLREGSKRKELMDFGIRFRQKYS